MIKKTAFTQVEINDLIANRWSGRAYDASQSLSHEQLVAVFEAARWAPSCYGDQPWRFLLLDKIKNQYGWQQALNCLSPTNQVWAKDAPVLILVCADSVFSHNQKQNRWAQYDTGAAVENLCLQASSMGMMAHQMGGFDMDTARENFAIPAKYTPMTMVTLGFPAHPSNLTEDVLLRETAIRARRPLKELFFAGAWGEPLVE